MSVRDEIIRAADEEGIDRATALAYAERESSFNPTAHSSRTIHGLFQMRGDLRAKYGIGDSDDPYTQTKGWAKFYKDLKGEMAERMGRNPTDAEVYLGHHFGGGRAARMLKGSITPDTGVGDVFTPYELSINPHIARAGNIGRLAGPIVSDIDRRRAKFGGSGGGQAPYGSGGGQAPDLSHLGTLVDEPEQSGNRFSGPPDLSHLGTLAEGQQPTQPPDFSHLGTLAQPDFSHLGTLVEQQGAA